MDFAGHLVQHAPGEAGCGQMRMDLRSANRQTRSGIPLPLKLRQLHTQCGEPGAPVCVRGRGSPRAAGDIRCWEHGLNWPQAGTRTKTELNVKPAREYAAK